MTHEGSGEQHHFAPEYFNSPTPETRDAFDAAVERLQRDFANQATSVRRDHLNTFAGDIVGHRVNMACSIEEWRHPATDAADTSTHLSISVETTDPLTATDPHIGGLLWPPKDREFSFGEVRGDMTDAEYADAVTYLRQKVPTDEWAWIEKARLLAGEKHDAEFLPFAVTELLDTAPPQLPVGRSKQYFLNPLNFTNGARLQVAWLEANPAHLRTLDPYDAARQITIALPTGEKYVYFAFVDGTEQMLVEARDETTRAVLTSQGFAAVDPRDGGWPAVTPERRRMGVQAPTNTLMSRFTSLIYAALESN